VSTTGHHSPIKYAANVRDGNDSSVDHLRNHRAHAIGSELTDPTPGARTEIYPQPEGFVPDIVLALVRNGNTIHVSSGDRDILTHKYRERALLCEPMPLS